MLKQDVYDIMNNNPVFSIATIDNGFPRVRGMLLFSADEKGIVFHIGTTRDVYRQIRENPNAELCFIDTQQMRQARISGTLEIVNDNDFKDMIAEHPSRGFVKDMRDNMKRQDFYDSFIVLRMQGGKANIWTYENNLGPNLELALD